MTAEELEKIEEILMGEWESLSEQQKRVVEDWLIWMKGPESAGSG
jgi:hypothetical protein